MLPARCSLDLDLGSAAQLEALIGQLARCQAPKLAED